MSQQTTDHYKVLGVEVSASTDEIKKAYRKKVRELHPDHNPDPQAAEDVKQVNRAYDVLSNDDKRADYDRTANLKSKYGDWVGSGFEDLFADFGFRPRGSYADWGERFTRPTVEVPKPEEFMYCGVKVRVNYDTFGHYASGLVADMYVQLDDVAKLNDLPNPTHNVQKVRQVYLMDGAEELHAVWVDDSITKLREETYRFIQQRELIERVTRAKLKLDSMSRNELPTKEAARLYDTASLRVRRLMYPHGYMRVSYDSALDAVRAFEKEIERLESSDPTELLVDGLMNGTLYPELAEHNREVLRQIEIFAIRTGGFWETEMNEEGLRAFYRKVLGGATSLRNVQLVDLELNVDNYVLEDVDSAPAKLTLNTRRGEKEYDVSYYYSDVEGVKTPTGAIVVPVSVFEQFAADYGKKSTFPDLGHGVKLWVSVKLAGDKYVNGWADDQNLIKRVEKRKKGLVRAADAATDMPTAAPPWARGQAARSRRR